jgi:hypothetical protein
MPFSTFLLRRRAGLMQQGAAHLETRCGKRPNGIRIANPAKCRARTLRRCNYILYYSFLASIKKNLHKGDFMSVNRVCMVILVLLFASSRVYAASCQMNSKGQQEYRVNSEDKWEKTPYLMTSNACKQVTVQFISRHWDSLTNCRVYVDGKVYLHFVNPALGFDEIYLTNPTDQVATLCATSIDDKDSLLMDELVKKFENEQSDWERNYERDRRIHLDERIKEALASRVTARQRINGPSLEESAKQAREAEDRERDRQRQQELAQRQQQQRQQQQHTQPSPTQSIPVVSNRDPVPCRTTGVSICGEVCHSNYRRDIGGCDSQLAGPGCKSAISASFNACAANCKAENHCQ